MTEAELTDPRLQVKRRRLDVARVWLAGIGAACSAAAVAVAVVLLVQLSDVAETNKANGTVVRDCVEQGGRCYEEGRTRAAESVRRITAALVAVEWCGRTAQTKPQLEACVAEALSG